VSALPWPALYATHGGIWLASPDGAVRGLGRGEAIARAAETPTILLNAPVTATRLGYGELSGLDLLELYAFVHPARFAVPTPAGLARARNRLGERAGNIRWITADITSGPRLGEFDVWHDRALFHFLMEPRDRAAYIANLRRILKPGGTAIIATFALDGPETCSGLPVRRYSPDTLAAELSEEFELVESVSHAHTTPRATTQAFQYSRFVRETTRQL